MPNQLSPRLRARQTSYYNCMKLRFKVDQGEALRQGIDAPTSITTIEVNPGDLTQAERNLLADRMDGIDVHALRLTQAIVQSKEGFVSLSRESMQKVKTTPIMAKSPTFESLLEAVKENERMLRQELKAQGKRLSAPNPEEENSPKQSAQKASSPKLDK